MSISDKYFKYLDKFEKTVTLEAFSKTEQGADCIALRHDIDHDINLAMEMAYYEHVRGHRTTYFLLHSAGYWSDPDFLEKALQIQDFGHEVGLHVNLLADWFSGGDEPGKALGKILQPLREAGLVIKGVAAHGDRICYEHQFINYWCFSELKPENPLVDETGLNAEGVKAICEEDFIHYPHNHELVRQDGQRLPLWSLRMFEYGLSYDAMHLACDCYFTDSRGRWERSPDPYSENLAEGRHQILIHPEHWRGAQKIYFFLSTARSGSKWLSNFLDVATPLRGRHEFTLNHRYDCKANELKPEKRTGNGFTSLVQQKDLARQLLLESRSWIEAQKKDYAEANVYLERFLPQLMDVFPDATYVHLHRDPKDVVRSIMNRNWYDLPDDDKHPVMEVNGWSNFSQLEKCCWYDRVTNESLLDFCQNRIVFEKMVEDFGYLESVLASLDIPVFPRMAARVFKDIVNANKNNSFEDFELWSDEYQTLYHGILWPVVMELGYASAGYEEVLGDLLKGYIKIIQQNRENRHKKNQEAGERECLDELVFSQESRKKFNAVGCKLQIDKEGLVAIPEGNRHATVVLGNGGWYEISANDGWEHRAGYYVRGSLDAFIENAGGFQLFCLMYDENGMQIEKRSLGGGQQQGDVRLDFSCRPIAHAARFNLAIYSDKNSLPRRLLIKKLAVNRVRD